MVVVMTTTGVVATGRPVQSKTSVFHFIFIFILILSQSAKPKLRSHGKHILALKNEWSGGACLKDSVILDLHGCGWPGLLRLQLPQQLPGPQPQLRLAVDAFFQSKALRLIQRPV